MILNKVFKNKERKDSIKKEGKVINFYEYIQSKNIKGKYNKFIKNTFVLLLVVSIILNNSVFSKTFESLRSTTYDEYLGDYRIYSRIGNEKYIYYQGRIQTNYEYYYLDKNGKEMPSYCLNLGIDGAETKDEYYVNASEKIEDNNLMALLLSGYPYKSVEELGVGSVTEAKYATQFAIWAYLTPLNIDQITPTDPSYQRVVNAIKNIYYKRSSMLSNEFDLVHINYSLFISDNIDDNYYSSVINLMYNENVKDINIQVEGVEKYILTDLNNNPIQDLSNVENLKVLIPKDIIYESKNVNVNVQYKTIQTAILFGASKIAGMQNVTINLEPIIPANTNVKLPIKYYPIPFEILKVDKENENIGIPNVKFRIYDMKDNFFGEYVTDENGKISFDDILKELKVKTGEKIKVKEIEGPENYYIDKENDTQIIEVKYLIPNKLVFKNEKIKGKVKIIKTSSDFNYFNNFDKGTFLKDAVFEIYDINNNLIEEITTNEKGEAISKDLLKGKYYVKEKSSPEHYILDNNVYKFEIIDHNKIVTLNIKNDSEKKIELPKTGF